MAVRDIDGSAVQETVAAVLPDFHTRDVSEHAIMKAAHGDMVAKRNYHAWVGSYLSTHAAELAIRLVRRRDSTGGALWSKLPSTASASLLADRDCRSRGRTMMPAAISGSLLCAAAIGWLIGMGPCQPAATQRAASSRVSSSANQEEAVLRYESARANWVGEFVLAWSHTDVSRLASIDLRIQGNRRKMRTALLRLNSICTRGRHIKNVPYCYRDTDREFCDALQVYQGALRKLLAGIERQDKSLVGDGLDEYYRAGSIYDTASDDFGSRLRERGR